MDLKQKKKLYLLLNALREEVITDKQFSELEHLLCSDAEAAREYVLYIKIWTDLQLFRAANADSDIVGSLTGLESTTDSDFWQAMADYEKNAPVIELPKREPQRELIQKVVYPPKEKRKISKLGTFTLINAAAILLFFLFLRFLPPKGGIEVATLTDSINAKWADMDGSMEKGSPLVTGMENLLLREGYAELLFNNDTRVILEGPAEFQILTEDQIKLRYGRLYAVVPREAIGFTVTTQTAKVIDLGTEFGIEADPHGDMYLCVTKGKTSLIAGDKSNKSNIEVGRGIAKKISGITQMVSDAVFEDRLFVRSIDSAEGILWRGQTEFNLADVVGGGNGFGTGRLDEGISLSDGAMESDYQGVGLKGTGDYVSVPGSAFVDGVFVPGVGLKPVRISSQGHIFKECPATGRFYTLLRNGGIGKKLGGTVYPLELNGQVYGTPETPAVLFMHSNAGITFDLDAVRKAMPGCQVQAFRSVVGISSNAEQVAKIDRSLIEGKLVDIFSAYDGKIAKSDVFVLVDGELRQTATVTHDPETIVSMDIKLTEQDRFLTLVSTESNNGFTYDWVMFARPLLILNTAE